MIESILKNLNNIKVVSYLHKKYDTTLKHIYVKNNEIFYAYRYDIISNVYNIIKNKIYRDELKFIVGNLTEYEFLEVVEQIKDHSIKKQIYTKLNGNIVKQNKLFYTEMISANMNYFQQLLLINKRLIPDLKILKIYVDEIITSHKLLIENIPNELEFNTTVTPFYVWVKKLEFFDKQLYINFDNTINIRMNSYNNNFLKKYEELFANYTGNQLKDELVKLSNAILMRKVDRSLLLYSDENNQPYILFKNNKIYDDYSEYDVNHYYNLHRVLSKYLLIADSFR